MDVAHFQAPPIEHEKLADDHDDNEDHRDSKQGDRAPALEV
jgi:hypothetical protein